MILSEIAKVKLWGSNMKHYFSLGYKGRKGDIIDVKIADLQNRSHAEIEVLCDMCNKNTMTVSYDTYNRVVNKTGSYVCRQCSYEKTAQTNEKIYGTRTPSKTDAIKEKTKQTNLERFGVPYYTQTKEIQEKIKQTCMDKYGVEHYAQLQEVKNKKAKTNLERYGFEYIPQVKEFKEKQLNTLYEHYGVKIPMHSLEIKEKLSETLYKNGTQKTSRQQLYLHNLYGGELNYSIKCYDVDICFPTEKMYVEYDGSGHDLSVRFGQKTQEEFNQREIIRFNIIKREGYKQMRIISRKDLLPSDKVLLQMLSIAKEYFNKTSHTWINFDIDNSKIINAKNKDTDGVFFDYGELRKIKESKIKQSA